MEITVAMRAHRSLKKLPCFRSTTVESLPKDALFEVGLKSDETLVGVYINTPESTESRVFFTDQGLHVGRGNRWEFLPYREMASVDLEGGEKSLEVDNLAIRLRSGEITLVPFTGGNAILGSRDTFTVWTFLTNVLGDIGKVGEKT